MISPLFNLGFSALEILLGFNLYFLFDIDPFLLNRTSLILPLLPFQDFGLQIT